MNENNATFEQNMARLEQIVRTLERGDAPLEESLKLFGEGTGLVRSCGALLDAAELAVPDQDALRQSLDDMLNAMAVAMENRIRRAGERLENLACRPVLKSPLASFESRRKALELLQNRLLSAQSGHIAKNRQRFVAQVSKLDAMSPLKVLTRGYAMAAKEDGTIVRSVKDVKPKDPIAVRVSDGTIVASVIGGTLNE